MPEHVVHLTNGEVAVRFDDIGPTFVLGRDGRVTETTSPPVGAYQIDTCEYDDEETP